MQGYKQFIKSGRVMEIFQEIVKYKRPSGDENEIRKYVIDFIKSLNNPAIRIVHYEPEAKDPGDQVLVIRKAAQQGGDPKTKIILQAHLDMVCNPSDMTFPLSTYTEEIDHVRWLKGRSHDGRNSTLGADDGMGVAIALAVMEDITMPAGQIECFFTVREETALEGARFFDPRNLEGRYYINLDSEEENIIYYGSAGGLKSQFEFKPEYLPIPEKESILVKLAISGLAGGHSGSNIHEGRANAIQFLARVLFELREGNLEMDGYDFNIVDFSTHNRATNIIPMDAAAIVRVARADLAKFQDSFATLCKSLKAEFVNTDPELTYLSEIADSTGYPEMLSSGHTKTLITLLLCIPHGVLRMDPVRKNVVQTSSNLAIVKREKDVFLIACSHRSSSETQLQWAGDIHRAIAASRGMVISNSGAYPAWTPNENSRLLQIARKVFQSHYGNNTQGVPLWESNIIHAGLECGWVVDKFKDDPHPMDCISIGPTVENAHTPSERLDIDSVQRFCDCLVDILLDLSAPNK